MGRYLPPVNVSCEPGREYDFIPRFMQDLKTGLSRKRIQSKDYYESLYSKLDIILRNCRVAIGSKQNVIIVPGVSFPRQKHDLYTSTYSRLDSANEHRRITKITWTFVFCS